MYTYFIKVKLNGDKTFFPIVPSILTVHVRFEILTRFVLEKS